MDNDIIVTEEQKRAAFTKCGGICHNYGCRTVIKNFKEAKFSHWEWYAPGWEQRKNYIKVYCYACHGWINMPGLTHLDLRPPKPKRSIVPVIPIQFKYFKY